VAIALVQPFGDPNGPLGGDIVGLDRTTLVIRPLASRADVSETLSFPAWWPDGSALLFNRSSRTSLTGTLDLLSMDGGAPISWIEDATHPTVAPDGGQVAFVRYSRTAASLMTFTPSTGQERTLIGGDRFLDIAYPRFSPDGGEIAFSVPGEGVMRDRGVLGALFGPTTAFAHGFPRDIWIVNADGTGLRPLAQLGADDPSLAWSPDGGQIFVYSGNGGWFVDPRSGASTRIDYLSGYGATAWLP
jgi:Tol biopolymer transport system component